MDFVKKFPKLKDTLGRLFGKDAQGENYRASGTSRDFDDLAFRMRQQTEQGAPANTTEYPGGDADYTSDAEEEITQIVPPSRGGEKQVMVTLASF